MGYNTDFVGHIDITPRLNEAEIAYLTAFSESRRYWREAGEYAVPGNPRAEEFDEVGAELINTPPPGQPNLWCDWNVCWDGCCLAWNGTEKSYSMISWLRYLITHFLKPGGKAEGSPGFEGFTFDHRLDGIVVGCRRDTKELIQVTVRDNRVSEKVLRPAGRRYLDLPALPYEAAKEREISARRRRRRTPDNVVELGR